MSFTAAHPDATLAIIAAADVVLLAWLFVRVGREQIVVEDTATTEMRARSLGFYTNHLIHDAPPAVTGRWGRKSRIADEAATTNGNPEVRV